MAQSILRLSSLEYDKILNDLINYIKTKYPDSWNDFLHSNLGMVFLEAVSAVGDNLAFYINQLANELFLPTATQRRAVVSLAKLVGYTPRRAQPAQGLIRFYLSSPLSYNVVIPKGTICETQNGIKFETTEEGVIVSGQSEVLVNAIQRDVGEVNFIAQEGFNELLIEDVGAYEFHVEVNGQKIEETEFIVDTFGDRAFKVEEKEDGYLLVFYLSEGDRVSVRYYTTKGKAGNVASGSINRVLTPIRDSTGNTVGILVDNLPFAGGDDREDVESIKRNAYLFTRTQDRAVSVEDYENLTLLVDGVYKARAKLVNWGCSANIVHIYICTLDSNGNPAVADAGLKARVEKELTEKGILTVNVYAQDVAFQSVSISGSLKVKQGFVFSDVTGRIDRALREMFSSLDIGQELRFSDLLRRIDEVEGVEWVEMTSPTATVVPASDTTLLVYGGSSWNAV